jgi:hypothetical protein
MLYRHFFNGLEPDTALIVEGIQGRTMAELQEAFLQNRNDPHLALRSLLASAPPTEKLLLANV